MIYTTYFANIRNLPNFIIPIAICGKSPEWYKGQEYKKLAPKYHFFMEWKRTRDNDYYIQHFEDEVLSKLAPENVMNDLMKLSNGEDVALVCYEKPMDFCHRHLVSKWLNDHGFSCIEASGELLGK